MPLPDKPVPVFVFFYSRPQRWGIRLAMAAQNMSEVRKYSRALALIS